MFATVLTTITTIWRPGFKNRQRLIDYIMLNDLHFVSLNSEIVTKERFCSATDQFIHKGYIHDSEKTKRNKAKGLL